jgi:hypothetical protein
MGCNCGGKRNTVKYRVSGIPGTEDRDVDTIAEAQSILVAAGRPAGATFRAVSR